MKKISTSTIVKTGMIAAIYAVVTMALAPISYGDIQFRISEVLTLLAFINPIYIPGLVLGCIIANLQSPLGIIDIALGSTATLLAVTCIYLTNKFLGTSLKSLIVASLWPVVFNGLIIGWMLNYLFQIPLVAAIGSVALGEFVVVSIFGVLVFNMIMKNRRFYNILSLGSTGTKRVQ